MLGAGEVGEDVMAQSSSDSFWVYDPDRLLGVLVDAQRRSSVEHLRALCLTVTPKYSGL